MNQPIKSALGLGQEYKLSNGATLAVAPCGLLDIEDAMKLYNDSLLNTSLHLIFLPGNEDKKEALHSLLLMANGQKFSDDQKDEREAAIRTIKEKFTDVGDFGSEVVKYIQRFLRVIPRDPGITQE